MCQLGGGSPCEPLAIAARWFVEVWIETYGAQNWKRSRPFASWTAARTESLRIERLGFRVRVLDEEA